MKKLVIDIKDNYAVFVASGDFKLEFGKIDFNEADFKDGPRTGKLLEIGGQKFKELYADAQEVVLIVPMRFSLTKIVEIDIAAIEIYGDEFLDWEARQQIPEKLGKFTFDFYKLGKSYDNKKIKYLFYAIPRELIDMLIIFATGSSGLKPILIPEAVGLFNALNLVSNKRGFNAVVALENDGSSVVLTSDGDFTSGKFIAGQGREKIKEIMYYVLCHNSENVKPPLLLCGDLSQVNNLEDFSWAELFKVKDAIGTDLKPELSNPEFFVTAAGISFSKSTL